MECRQIRKDRQLFQWHPTRSSTEQLVAQVLLSVTPKLVSVTAGACLSACDSPAAHLCCLIKLQSPPSAVSTL